MVEAHSFLLKKVMLRPLSLIVLDDYLNQRLQQAPRYEDPQSLA